MYKNVCINIKGMYNNKRLPYSSILLDVHRQTLTESGMNHLLQPIWIQTLSSVLEDLDKARLSDHKFEVLICLSTH